MTKNYKKKIIITTLATIAPMLAGLMLWKKMPDSIPIHFGMNGEPDNWTNKFIPVVILPLALAAIHVFSLIMTLNDPKKKNIGNQMLNIIFWMIPLVTWVGCIAIYMYAMGMKFNMARVVMFIVGVLFIILGNYMTKNHQNYTVGIRLPWTLHSRENWNRTHRLAAKLWMFGGMVCIFEGFLQTNWLIFIVLAAITILPIGYSFILYKKGI